MLNDDKAARQQAARRTAALRQAIKGTTMPTLIRPLTAALLAALPFAAAADTGQTAENTDGFLNTPFFQDGKLSITHRNFYFNRDFRDGGANPFGTNWGKPLAERNGERNEWAHGIIVDAQSGVTSGKIGFGAEVKGLAGIRLDSSGARTGTGLIPYTNGADGKPERLWGSIGGAVKAKIGETVIKAGNSLTPANPILHTADVRLLPVTATGIALESKDFDKLNLQAGTFTHVRAQESTNHDDRFSTDQNGNAQVKRISYVGGRYTWQPHTWAQVYAGELKDHFNQYHAQANHRWQFDGGSYFNVNAAGYYNRDSGAEKAGPVNTKLAALTATYGNDTHALTLGIQRVFGDDPLDYAATRTIGSLARYPNAGWVTQFSEANEKSWQVRYDLDFKKLGAPGLALMGRYIKGYGMDNSKGNDYYRKLRGNYTYQAGDKHWERNIEAKYTVQSGKAKGLNLRVRQTSMRTSGTYRYGNIDEVRVIAEYPWSL
ncbi:OprD family outer membrane porin [Neisseria animalis]|uniref:OprD family outer membrane porin n=1 Tax=Neisseria animalis TaxID=492 RepID=UPI000F4ECBFE|nr:OprD family outer membrane porin [Neisseria animalis]ROW31590.1 outer membrane porin, OprD family [Neisseria animalis]